MKKKTIELRIDDEKQLKVILDCLENIECVTDDCPGIAHCFPDREIYPCSELCNQAEFLQGRRKLIVTEPNVKYMSYLLNLYLESNCDFPEIAKAYLKQLK